MDVVNSSKRGPKPKPPDERRSVLMQVRMKPRGADRLRVAAGAAGLSVPDAMREAVNQWVQRQEKER